MDEKMSKEFIAETEDFIIENEAWLENTINSIGWTMENVAALADADQSEFVYCPLNPEHRMPASSLETHLIKCNKIHGTYPDVSNLDLNVNTYLQETSSVPKLELDHEAVCDSEKAKTLTERSSQSLAELLEMERDAKRRRAAHRGKRVHSNKKSYSEVMREVIANQMLMLNDNPENVENYQLNREPESQKSAQCSTYLGVGELYRSGNPYKRWLKIEQEEKEILERMQKQSVKHSQDDQNFHYSQDERLEKSQHSHYSQDDPREKDRNSYYSRRNRSHRSLHREYQDKHGQYYKSYERDRTCRESRENDRETYFECQKLGESNSSERKRQREKSEEFSDHEKKHTKKKKKKEKHKKKRKKSSS